MPKVTAIIPVHNKMPYLQDTLNSVRRQTLKDIEILIVDDASTDSSPLYLKKCAAEDERISLYTLKNNVGPSGADNYGISHAKGDYFTIIDADDFVDPEYLEVLYSQACKYETDISMCRNDIFYNEYKREQLAYNGPDEVVLCQDLVQTKMKNLSSSSAG